MIDTPAQRERPASTAAARLTRLAGWSLITIAVLHTAVFVPQVPWGEWLDGTLRSGEADMESVAVFWALPGGIVVPGALAGALLIRGARQGTRFGLGVAITLVAWVSACLWLIGPSGFMFVYVTAGLLIAAAVVDRRRA
ncbi:hypothetical protein [Glycomyces terrestris]|uniref:Uncharacterized protein n=1 Tax=Glycomyces terrestris TaxID=2493553 RepID=A0A426V0N5_9ACTN|nr:hypothetical protein [Glycomyces terrestris]RRS00451.1 hypothetical protein EIW28_07760 [Glycomyces terrestris]